MLVEVRSGEGIPLINSMPRRLPATVFRCMADTVLRTNKGINSVHGKDPAKPCKRRIEGHIDKQFP